MLSKGSLFCVAILVAAMFVSGCNDKTPSGPSTLPSITSSAAPGAPEQSRLVGRWNVTVRVDEARGKGCVGDSLRAEINAHSQYSLSIVQKGDATNVTLASASGDFVCTYPAHVDSAGFTEARGGYTCERGERVVTCDGIQHTLATFGQTVTGRFSGNEVSGIWNADWVDSKWFFDPDYVDMKAQFTGRQ